MDIAGHLIDHRGRLARGTPHAATWLDHAGVSPKVASQIVGHKTPEYQVGAARITLDRYTHVLPGELEHARELLDRFLLQGAGEEKKTRRLEARALLFRWRRRLWRQWHQVGWRRWGFRSVLRRQGAALGEGWSFAAWLRRRVV